MNTARKSVNIGGTTRWHDDRDRLHRDDGPAVIYPYGVEKWFRHGKMHREDGPALLGTRHPGVWYLNNIKVLTYEEFQKILGCGDDYIIFLKLRWGEF